MRRLRQACLLLTALAAGACGGKGPKEVPQDAGPKPDAAPEVTFEDCAASDQSFVRNAYLGILGRRPASQAEVNVYVDLMREVRALGEADLPAPDPREAVVVALMQDPGYVGRWADHVMDALKVPRIEVQSQRSCYGDPQRQTDDGSLAAFVRERHGTSGGDGLGPFTMIDLLRSALVLDDLSPVYRAHLYALVSRPIPAANVPRVEAELARREDFGLVFDAAYLHRDMVCLGCHNSEASVTDHPAPELDRHWPLPGHFSTALYGKPTGVDPARAHAPLRYDGFVADIFAGDPGDARPWDWDPSCGGFYPQDLEPDPAGIDGLFASLSGDRMTVYDLEAALGRGFETLRESGLPIGDEGAISDPDAAFAYLVSANIVERVWEEVIGSPLTIANYFPRNEASRDILHQLTETFIERDFSLRAVLIEIVSSPYFNRLEPAAGCGESPYNMPAVFDPWTVADEDPARRKNGPGDSVSALSARTLMRAAYEALEWERPYFMDFPEMPRSIDLCDEMFTCEEMESLCAGDGDCCLAHDYLCDNPPPPGEPGARQSRAFQRGVGVFLKNGEGGFRGLDFQARLIFEDRFGACRNPGAEPDFIAALVTRASEEGASLGDLVAAEKDRLVGRAAVSEAPGPQGVSERDAIEELFGASLDAPADSVDDLEARARLFCGSLLASPQFLLAGLAVPDGGEVPALTPAALRYDAICAEVAARSLPGGLSASCASGKLSVGSSR